jgi:hypothetical protein
LEVPSKWRRKNCRALTQVLDTLHNYSNATQKTDAKNATHVNATQENATATLRNKTLFRNATRYVTTTRKLEPERNTHLLCRKDRANDPPLQSAWEGPRSSPKKMALCEEGQGGEATREANFTWSARDSACAKRSDMTAFVVLVVQETAAVAGPNEKAKIRRKRMHCGPNEDLHLSWSKPRARTLFSFPVKRGGGASFGGGENRGKDG